MLLKATKQAVIPAYDAECISEGEASLQSIVNVIRSSVTVAHVQFREDPVTQIVDLLVIKDRYRLHLRNHKLSMFIAQPFTHTLSPTLQSPCGMKDSEIPQLPHSTTPPSSRTPLLLTSPCLYVHMHSTTSHLLRCTFFCVIRLRSDWAFPVLSSDHSRLALLLHAQSPKPPQRKIIGIHFDVHIYL